MQKTTDRRIPHFGRVNNMKALFGLALLLLTSVPGAAAQTPKELTAKQIFDKWSKAVVTIKAGKQTGTGFFDDSGRLYTAFHVVKSAVLAKVVFSDGKEVAVRGFTAADPLRDIAILSTEYYPGWESREKGPKIGDYDTVNVGDRVVVIGSPLGLSGSITEGLASGKRTDDSVSLLQLSAGVSPGSSGSPVFNTQGEVVGMVIGSLESGQSLNFAVSSKDLDSATTVPLWLLSDEVLGKLSPNSSSSILKSQKFPPESLILQGASGLMQMTDTSLLIEQVPTELKDDLSESDVEDWVKQRIETGGFKILSRDTQFEDFAKSSQDTEAEILAAKDRCFRQVYINVFAMKSEVDSTLFYFCRLRVDRGGFVVPGHFTSVTVYEDGMGGYAGSYHSPKQVVRKAIEKLVDRFVEKWKLANKKD